MSLGPLPLRNTPGFCPSGEWARFGVKLSLWRINLETKIASTKSWQHTASSAFGREMDFR
jgi:hypothetical protein